MIRPDFVKSVSDPVIKCLLDKLLHQKVLLSEEKDSVINQQDRSDRARYLIDMVILKGESASQKMIDSMKVYDNYLCLTLGLISSPTG